MKSYKINFYQLTVISTTQIDTPSTGFQKIDRGDIKATYQDDKFVREIYALTDRGSGQWAGVLRKYRTDDLPVIAKPGEEETDIDLEEDEAIVEQNCFVFYPDHSLIGWQVDTHGSHHKRFENVLANLWGTEVSLDPVIQPDAVRRLMRGEIELKKIRLTVPRPSNPQLFSDNDFRGSMMGLFDGTNADNMQLQMGVDLRRDKEARLNEKVKTFLKEVFDTGATTAKADVFRDGEEGVIDLIADRVSSQQETETDGRVSALTMYRLIDAAKEQCQEVLNGYFGRNNEALD